MNIESFAMIRGDQLEFPQYLALGTREHKKHERNIVGPPYDIFTINTPDKYFYQRFADAWNKEGLTDKLQYFKMKGVDRNIPLLEQLNPSWTMTKAKKFQYSGPIANNNNCQRIIKWIAQRNLLSQKNNPQALVSQDKAIELFLKSFERVQ